MNKIAYLIQCHKGYKQILKLVDKLKCEDLVDIYIHVDCKSLKLKELLSSFYVEDERVTIIPFSVSVFWSDISQVHATLESLEFIINISDCYTHISFISGEDWPLKSSYSIVEFLNENRNANFLSYEAIGNYRWRLIQYNFLTGKINTRRWYFKFLRAFLKTMQGLLCIKRTTLKNKVLYKGSCWFTLTPDAISFILKSKDKRLEPYIYSSCGDEHFFQIELLNSRFKSEIVNNNLRYIEFKPGASSPVVFSLAELPFTKLDNNMLWIRKVKF
ncbi:beta-1,6-N-acetylglucosaminyltransferase [Vibrio hibernica]|uniref:beta-1,6-N-acetylglucosaminyltransferase n=1 Tax=Vibrio hibernica TaxID=2587465 RepID=UPI00187E2895|nr:beta-1,6-N-acetylglucosaminyltransferase [Vibrio hibernica]